MKTTKNFWMLLGVTLALFALIMFGCEPDDEPEVPVLTTAEVTDITRATATSGGAITSDGGAAVTSRGVCWSTEEMPTVEDNKTDDGTGIGGFTSSITGLTPNTTYYVRAYALNSAGTGYGDEVNFITLELTYSSVTDIDGNVYKTIQIGDQVWMAENLKVTHYRNGDAIPNVTDDSEWNYLTTGAYCNNDNDENNAITYGRLYNWYAVNDSRNIAPEGWHVPSDAEWTILIDYLGGEDIAGVKLKEAGNAHWTNNVATNESGFSALPGGCRGYNAVYGAPGDNYGCWWSCTEKDIDWAWDWYVCNWSWIARDYDDKHYGFSVRCVKD